MLSTPQDSMELQHKQSKPVAVTSFSFLANDVNNFVVGSEEGNDNNFVSIIFIIIIFFIILFSDDNN